MPARWVRHDERMSEQPLRVAIIGFGIGGAVFHAPLIASTPGMRVAYVVTSNAERAANARSSYGGVAVIATADELFARAADVDLVVVTSPNREHAPQALQAIKAGIPVVVDKPFAVGVDQAQAVVDTAAAANVPLTVFQNRRFDGDFLTVQRPAIVKGAARHWPALAPAVQGAETLCD